MTAVTSACVLALVAMVAPSGVAAPSRDIREVQAQVRDLEMRAADATERYNAAQLELNQTQQRLGTVKDKVDRQKADLAVTLASMDDLARGVYMSGGMDTSLQVLLADDPTDFLAQSAALDQLSQSQAADVRRTQTARLHLAQSEAELADQEGIAKGLRDEMDAAKQSAADQLAQAQDVLASLEEAERQRLAELQAQQAREAKAAAEAASAAIAAAAAAANDASAGSQSSGDSGDSGSDSGGDTGGDSGASSAGGGFTGGGRAAIAVQYALSQVGKRYVAAADGPDSFDCSGLTMAAWRQAGVSLAHYSYSQFSQVQRISDSELQPGDLVFYFGSGAHHVGMYIGGGKMVSASNPSDGVEVIDYKGPWYGERYSGAGRVVG